MSTAPLTLPRSRALTEALFGTVGRGISEPDRADLTARVDLGLHALGLPRPSGSSRLRLDGYLIGYLSRPTSHRAHPLPWETPFMWSAVAAKRSIGLAALRLCLGDPARTPSEAVDRAMWTEEVAAPTDRPGSLGRWLATLGPGARAATRAEAVGWTTAVLGALDWEQFGPGDDIGGPDRWWESPSVPHVTLRGRAEVRAHTQDDPPSSAGLVLLVVLSGWPGPTARVELGINALAHALAAEGPTQVPRRITGWWPQAGRSLALDVDRTLLDHAADAAILAARTLRDRPVETP